MLPSTAPSPVVQKYLRGVPSIAACRCTFHAKLQFVAAACFRGLLFDAKRAHNDDFRARMGDFFDVID